MRDVHQRIFIVIDEWAGIFTLIHLDETGSRLFWPFLIAWLIAIYGVSYPWYWWTFRRSEVDQGRSVVERGDRRAVNRRAAPEPA